MGQIFGEELRARRERAGLSGSKLAMLSGIPQSNISEIERGKRPPSQANLKALSEVEALGWTYAELKHLAIRDKIGRIKAGPGLMGQVGAMFEEDRRIAQEWWKTWEGLRALPPEERAQEERRIQQKVRNTERAAYADEGESDEHYVDSIEHEWLRWLRRLPFEQVQALLVLSPEQLTELLLSAQHDRSK